MFMFRNRRNTLAKRLWKARVLQREPDHAREQPAPGAAGAVGASVRPPLSQEAVLRNSFLKRLKDPQLETLLQAVESRGAMLTECVLLDAGLQLDPHLLCCQIWRWPELQQRSELRRLPLCGSRSDPTAICCNPYHWSRLCKPESPPPPYDRLPQKRLKPEGPAPSERSHEERRPSPCDHPPASPPPPPCEGSPGHIPGQPPPPGDPPGDPPADPSTEEAAWGRTPPRWQGSLTTNGEGCTVPGTGVRPWCQLAYWELADRVGRLYAVQSPSVNVSAAAEPSNQGMCLETLANHAPSRPAGTPPAVERTRAKIGLGVTLSKEDDGVWAYNRSDNPIFVNSPTLDDPESRTLLVYRVPPGHCLNIFRADTTSKHWQRWRRCNEAAHTGPVDSHAVRISFAKGWGPKYSRQEVTACPCWLEVLLQRPPRAPPSPPCPSPARSPCR